MKDLFGHSPESLIGKPLDMLIPERLRAHHGKHTAGFMRSPNNREMGARIADLFALRADGSEFSAGIRLAPFRIGGKLFVAAAIRDTTERRLVNEELVAARKEAERANRAKSRFLATASHDLRQPMQTIQLLNASMLKFVPEPQVRELLQQQGQAIESMTRLLNALLDISRLESGAIEPVSVDFSVAEVFEELRSEFSSLAHARGIDLRIEQPRVVLSTDRTLFYQLLQNLVGNALKYTDQRLGARQLLGRRGRRGHRRRGFRHRHPGRQARADLRRVLPGRHAWHQAHGRGVGPGDREGSGAPARIYREDPVRRSVRARKPRCGFRTSIARAAAGPRVSSMSRHRRLPRLRARRD